MKKKNILIIAIAIALIITSIVIIFISRDSDETDSTFDPLNSLENYDATEIPNKLPDESYDNIAESMGITRDELDEIITTPLDLTPEQKENIDAILNKYAIPEIDRFIEDDDPNDNVYTYIDTDGNQGTLTLNTPEVTEDDVDSFYDDLDSFLEQLENEDIPLEDIAPPTLGGDTDGSDETDTDTPIYDSDGNIQDEEDGYNGELEGTEEVDTTDYWVKYYGMTAEEIRNLSDEEKIALGFRQRSNGTWVDEDYMMLPPEELSEEGKEAANESSEGINWQG